MVINNRDRRWIRRRLYRLFSLGKWSDSVTNDETSEELESQRQKIEQDIIDWIEKHTDCQENDNAS